MKIELGAVCGIVSPIAFGVILVSLSSFLPAYSHFSQYISELGALGSPVSFLMNTLGFGLLGILSLVFAYGLYHGIGKKSVLGPGFVALAALSMILVGAFPCDIACSGSSLTGNLHTVFTVLVVLSITLGMLKLSHTFKKQKLWKNYWVYSLLTGIIILFLIPFYFFAIIADLVGLFQRIIVLLALVWVEVLALRLVRVKLPCKQ